jgi:prophage maintenance system killer protein
MEFLALNGTTLDVDPDALADMILDVAAADPATREQVVEELSVKMSELIVSLGEGA